MQHPFKFTANDTDYFMEEFNEGFGWSNDRDEEASRFHATILAAQQDALEWESGRRDRYEGSEAQEIDARNRYHNQRTDDARHAKHEE